MNQNLLNRINLIKLIYILTITVIVLSSFTSSKAVIVPFIMLLLLTSLLIRREKIGWSKIKIDPKYVLPLILILGFYLRIQGLHVESLTHDEAISSNIASSLAEKGVPQHPSGAEEWRSIPHIFLLSIFGSIFGFSEFNLRLISIMMSLFSTILIFYIGKDIFTRDVGLISATILSVFSWQIVWSQQARMYALFQFSYLLSIYLIYKTGKKPITKNILLLTAAIALSMLTHITAYILPFIFLSYMAYIGFNERRDQLKILLTCVFVSLWVWLVSSLYFDYRHMVFYRLVITEPYLYNLYLNWIWESNSLIIFSLGVIGFFASFKSNKNVNILFILATIPAVTVYMFFRPTAAPRYIYFTIPFFTIWSSLAIIELSSKISDKFNRIFLVFFVFVICIILALPSNLSILDTTPDYKSAYNYVEENYETDDKLISDKSPPASFYFKEPDKGLVRPSWEDQLIRDWGERYSGAKVINSSSELNNTISKNEDFWLVIEDSSYMIWKDTVQKNLGEPKFESHKIKVWKN